MGKYCTKFLREKTDAECRELSKHYYVRARRAEREKAELQVEIDRARAEVARLKSIAMDMLE